MADGVRQFFECGFVVGPLCCIGCSLNKFSEGPIVATSAALQPFAFRVLTRSSPPESHLPWHGGSWGQIGRVAAVLAKLDYYIKLFQRQPHCVI
jgi:hypothetical protein